MSFDTDEESLARLAEFFEKTNGEVPEKARNGMAEVGRLDRLYEKGSVEVKLKKINFMANYEKLKPENRISMFLLIQTESRKLLEICDRKAEITKMLHLMIEETIESLNSLDKNLIENRPTPTKQEPLAEIAEANQNQPVTQNRHRKKKLSEGDDDDVQKKKSKKKKDDEEGDDKRMYCWCRLDKPDDMVLCENPNCKHEWFHFSCIGMLTAPSGDWYCCNDCRDEAKTLKTKKKDEVVVRKGGVKRKK